MLTQPCDHKMLTYELALELLMPLTAAADLPTHPSLSIPYKSDVLPAMIQQACEMVHKERRTLWEIKHLLTKFRGCDTWIPCELFISDNDAALFGDQSIKGKAPLPALNIDNGIVEAHSTMAPNNQIHENLKRDNFRVDARATEPTEMGKRSGKNLGLEVEAATTDVNGTSNDRIHGKPEAMETSSEVYRENDQIDRLEEPNQYRPPGPVDNTDDSNDREQTDRPTSETNPVIDDQRAEHLGEAGVAMDARPTEEGGEADGVEAPAHRMTTRAQAQASSNDKLSSPRTRSPSHDSSTPPYVHPLFLVPPSAIPDRDIGLPTVEADDTRRVLAMFVQKQEEVVRGAERLYQGLLKADRMRRTVFAWCKAEGHLGEMSDGEDWYDQEGWGLEEPLKKGQMDEEDDSAEKGKKTRGRRGAQ